MNVEKYIPIPCQQFLHMDKVPCDIYIRMKKGSAFDYVKRIHKDEPFDNGDIERYISQGLAHFYVETEQHVLLTEALSVKMAGTLDNKRLGIQDRIRLTQTSFDLAMGMLSQVGFKGGANQLIESTVISITQETQTDSKLSSLLSNLLKNPGSYRAMHAHINALVSSRMIDEIEWGNPNHKKTLGFVALLHDITITDNNLVRVHDLVSLNEKNLSAQQLTQLKCHALEASVLVEEHPGLPFGVESIIKHHHGSTSGMGFGQITPGKIEPLTMVFMIAEEFSGKIIHANESGKTFDMKAHWDDLYQRHPQKQVVSIIDAMKMAFSH